MTDLSGRYLGRYYLKERLGEGGMAVVYKGYDTRLERDVAIKIIRSGAFPTDALDEVLKRFEREAKSLAKLSHPNIVKVHDYGEHEGSPYVVMEYLPGGTLKKLLGNPFPWQAAVRLIVPVAYGVAYAHRHGILHRDIKPANILITESGDPMLSDFGIAKLFEGDQTTALTGSGMAIGTPEYMAPEQWTGTTSPQSDLYSLGIVLYEMVAGRKPYVADTPAAILIKQATEPLPSPRKFASDLPGALERVLIKVLAKEPDDRYSEVNAFIDALEFLQADVSTVRSFPPEQKPAEATHKISPPESVERVPTETLTREDGESIQAIDVTEKAGQETITSEVVEKHKEETTAQEVEQDKAEQERVEVEAIEEAVQDKSKRQSVRNLAMPFPKVIVIGLLGIILVLFLVGFWIINNTFAAAPTISKNLYFTSGQSGKREIYWLDANGQVRQVTHTGGQGESWSPVPDGHGNLYFTSNQAGKTEIYWMNANGQINRVTNTGGQSESWSPFPDGHGNLYFTSNQAGKAEIYWMDVHGQITRVTNTNGTYESWSPVPDGQGNLYFTSNQTGRAEVYWMNVHGQITQVTNTGSPGASWSPVPDGHGNLYFTSTQAGKTEIYWMNTKGQVSQVTDTNNLAPSWSPVLAGQGNIYFTSDQGTGVHVFFMNADGVISEKAQGWTGTLDERYLGK